MINSLVTIYHPTEGHSQIKSLKDLFQHFPTEQSCIDKLESVRWNGIVISPFKDDSKIYKCKNNRYFCQSSKKYFNALTGTLFECTKLELRTWFLAIWLITSEKKGISSIQLSKHLGITQKTAWFVLQRIRFCFKCENYNTLDGVVEADESFYGGKNKNRHKDKKVKNSQGRSYKDKTPILGMIQRNGKMTALVVLNTSPRVLQPIIKHFVKPGSVFISDDWKGYKGLEKTYEHYSVKHKNTNFKNIYDNSKNTNQIEGAWKIMKNSLRDLYNHVSKKHLQKYIDEFVFRYNTRKFLESDRFMLFLNNIQHRLTYKMLISQLTN